MRGGTAVNAGGVRPGSTTVIYGIGGGGMNAMELGAQAHRSIPGGGYEAHQGVGADQALITVAVVTEEVIASAFAAVRKRGTVGDH